MLSALIDSAAATAGSTIVNVDPSPGDDEQRTVPP
jgi:hypothetical protein